MTVGIGAVVSFLRARSDLDAHAGERALSVARVVATDADVVEAFTAPEPPAIIDPIAEHFRAGDRGSVHRRGRIARGSVSRTQSADDRHVACCDDPGENPQAVLSGKTFVGVQTGSLGRPCGRRCRSAMRDGKVIGLVSVGVSRRAISETLRGDLLVYLHPGDPRARPRRDRRRCCSSRRVKRQTFGLEPGEIATLLEQREAMLHGIREGAVTVDDRAAGSRWSTTRRSACSASTATPSAGGWPSSCPPAASRRCSRATSAGRTRSSSCATACSSSTACRSTLRGGPSAPSSRCATAPSWTRSLRELQDVRGLADALRAQEHEFAHRLHVIGGLVELGRYEEAVQLHQPLVARPPGARGVGRRLDRRPGRRRRCSWARRRSPASAGCSSRCRPDRRCPRTARRGLHGLVTDHREPDRQRDRLGVARRRRRPRRGRDRRRGRSLCRPRPRLRPGRRPGASPTRSSPTASPRRRRAGPATAAASGSRSSARRCAGGGGRVAVANDDGAVFTVTCRSAAVRAVPVP